MANLFSEKPIVKVVMLKGQDGEEKLINQADGSGLSFWIGTQAEYDAIPESQLIANCVYYITDDTRDDFNTRLNELDTKVDNDILALQSLKDDLFFKINDMGTITYLGAGYITSSKEKIEFSVPLPKLLPTGLKCNEVGMNLSIRQNGNYLIGNSSGPQATTGMATITRSGLSSINVILNVDSSTPFYDIANAVNNETVGVYIELNYKIVADS